MQYELVEHSCAKKREYIHVNEASKFYFCWMKKDCTSILNITYKVGFETSSTQF